MRGKAIKTYVTALIKGLAKFAFTVGLLYAAFSFLFHFGDTQALGLGLAFAIAIDFAASKKPPQQASFTPHRLSIRFHLYPMLMDLGLIAGDEQWKALCGDPPSPRLWEENSVYHHSISAFVIGTDPGLIHFPVLQFYSEYWKFDIKLNGIQRAGSVWPWSPEVFVGPGHGGNHRGYHIGIRVQEKWWETTKPSVPPGVVLYEDKEWNFGTVRLTLASLPYEVTHTYYRATARDHQETVKELVAKSGWSNTDLGGAEIGYFGESYEHKYATIWAQHLDL
jgi:hypothetical protein